MPLYIIKNKSNGMYLSKKRYGNLWTKQFNEARIYSNAGAAKNSINNRWGYLKEYKNDLELVEVDLYII
jgi:hypothetical protein